MLLSIIIVSYNSSEVLIKNCLESIRKNKNNIDQEVIIVNNNTRDNGKQEKLLTISEEFFDLNLKLIKAKENKGFGAGNNEGANAAIGKYLLILNADTIIENNAIRKMIDFLEKNSKVAIVGPKLVYQNKKTQKWSCGPKTSLWGVIKNNLGITQKKFWESNTPTEVDCVSGAALMIRKEVFEKINGFDEFFFMYFEDEDLCLRVKELGYGVYRLGNIEIVHLEGESFRKDSSGQKNMKRMFYQSQDYFFKKHYGNLTAMLLKALRTLFG